MFGKYEYVVKYTIVITKCFSLKTWLLTGKRRHANICLHALLENNILQTVFNIYMGGQVCLVYLSIFLS